MLFFVLEYGFRFFERRMRRGLQPQKRHLSGLVKQWSRLSIRHRCSIGVKRNRMKTEDGIVSD